ncbi:hypothetical protein F7725_022128 [Dissostichus mawsoni]|uniref:Uncharacterized protein n=1 Tax=Dissostichus mawsoni TaxID=36200 RepID=A0A7J5ZFE0_DISMA|nr:hypothetical protein F7725_022128 [Dissostichus mawsoni]
MSLSPEAVQGAALPLQSIHHIHGGHLLPLGVLGVGDGITDHVLQETPSAHRGSPRRSDRDTLHSAAASQTADGGLGDALDVITEHFTTGSHTVEQSAPAHQTGSHTVERSAPAHQTGSHTHSLDVGQHASLSDGHSSQQLVQLLVVADGELQVAGDDTGLLVVPGGVSSQLQDLSAGLTTFFTAFLGVTVFLGVGAFLGAAFLAATFFFGLFVIFFTGDFLAAVAGFFAFLGVNAFLAAGFLAAGFFAAATAAGFLALAAGFFATFLGFSAALKEPLAPDPLTCTSDPFSSNLFTARLIPERPAPSSEPGKKYLYGPWRR